jgi:hypothetical protein
MPIRFRSEITVAPLPCPINHKSRVFLCGSCFTENIGGWLSEHLFDTNTNPFGILYNPVSLTNCINRCCNDLQYSEQELLEYDNHFLSLDHHSSFNGINSTEALNSINNKINEAHQFLKTATHLFITLGSSWVYEYCETNKIAGNCHKLPAAGFKKRVLSTLEISEALQKLISKVKKYNPEVGIIFTVSPVRHLRDGIIENTLSKSKLIAGIGEIINPTENIFYFPAYELIADDLKDYRFYKADLMHPTEQAIDYVKEKFENAFFNDNTKSIVTEINKLLLFLKHRSSNLHNKEYKEKIERANSRLQEIKNAFKIENK